LHAETSIDEKELDVALNRDDAAKQLKFTRDWLNERLFDEDTFEWHEHHFIAINKLKKDDLIKKLVQLRKEYFRRDSNAKDRHIAKAQASFDEKHPGQSSANRFLQASSPISQELILKLLLSLRAFFS
jgi:hypothetical protein